MKNPFKRDYSFRVSYWQLIGMLTGSMFFTLGFYSTMEALRSPGVIIWLAITCGIIGIVLLFLSFTNLKPEE
jgi:amino acid transporter